MGWWNWRDGPRLACNKLGRVQQWKLSYMVAISCLVWPCLFSVCWTERFRLGVWCLLPYFNRTAKQHAWLGHDLQRYWEISQAPHKNTENRTDFHRCWVSRLNSCWCYAQLVAFREKVVVRSGRVCVLLDRLLFHQPQSYMVNTKFLLAVSNAVWSRITVDRLQRWGLGWWTNNSAFGPK